MEEQWTINGTVYRYRQQYLPEDKLWECAYVDENGNMAEIEQGKFVCYDEHLGRAKRELEEMASENGLKSHQDNNLLLLRNLDGATQRKIRVLAKTVKQRVMGEWNTDEGHYEAWRKIMFAHTGISFPPAQYRYFCE